MNILDRAKKVKKILGRDGGFGIPNPVNGKIDFYYAGGGIENWFRHMIVEDFRTIHCSEQNMEWEGLDEKEEAELKEALDAYSEIGKRREPILDLHAYDIIHDQKKSGYGRR